MARLPKRRLGYFVGFAGVSTHPTGLYPGTKAQE
jgi:hypothetical protein